MAWRGVAWHAQVLASRLPRPLSSSLEVAPDTDRVLFTKPSIFLGLFLHVIDVCLLR